ncbi:MAG TPA: hypothetical protein VFE32_05785 [Puia sp.]|nr:hypothetical protein [Puia sp.]
MKGEIRQIRDEIRAGQCRGEVFRRLMVAKFSGHGGFGDADVPGQIGYDELDVFVNRLLGSGKMPEPTMELEAQMVEFYKTPARVVFELAERVSFGPGETFVDLGAGLGQVVILLHLLTGVRTLGVEIEPAYCRYGRRCSEELGLTAVNIVEDDARIADLTAGTVFFLFTPFQGEVFDEVMERLRLVTRRKQIRVIGYGPCSAEIARLDWLKREGSGKEGDYSLQVFNNFPASI